MCGTIFAISIIASIYLASNFQAHEMGVMALQYSQPPIRISVGNVTKQSTNVTEIDQIPNIVNTVDAQGDHIVDKIDRNIVMTFANISAYGCPYFFTKSQTINWSTFTYNSTTMSSVEILARDYLALFQSPSFYFTSGRFPQEQKELVISQALATEMSLAVNDTITIGNNYTHQFESGFKVVGVSNYSSGYHAYDYFIYMQYPDFDALIKTMHVHGIINVINSTDILDVYVNLNTVDIYNINDFVSKVDHLSTMIDDGISVAGLDFRVINYMYYLQNASIELIIYALYYLALLLALLLPVILLSNHTSDTINQEMFEQRAMEFGQFRSRGFDRRHMIKILGWEIVFSACMCAVVSGAIGIGLSYVFYPLIGTTQNSITNIVIVFNPFLNVDVIGYYIAIVVALSLVIIAIMYARPIQIAFEKEMIQTLRVQIQARRRKREVATGIVFSFVIGIIPLALYVVMMVITSPSRFLSVLQTYSPVFDALTIASPFFLSFSIIKWLGEKKPGWFAKLCTIFVRKTGNNLKHVVIRNIEAKSPKIVKLVVIVIITIAFGLTVTISNRSLTNYQLEQSRIMVGSDISIPYTGNYSFLNSMNLAVNTKGNVSASCSLIQAQAEVYNQGTYFLYQYINVAMTNLTQVAAVSPMLKDKYLVSGSWASILALSQTTNNIALIPASLKDQVQGSTITVGISLEANGLPLSLSETCTIAGYYKAFPGFTSDVSPSNYYYYGYYSGAPIILNLDFWKTFNASISTSFDMTVLIKTPFNDQAHIDAAAAAMNLGPYTTLDHATQGITQVPVYFESLSSNPLFYQLLNLDFWLMLGISIIGIAIITFMKITKERKEIGLFRVRGFDNRMMFGLQLNEKYMPLLVGGVVGIVAGFCAGILMTYVIGFNFYPFNPNYNFPIDIIFTFSDVFLQILVPMIVYFIVIMLAIRFELKQNLGSIMDEED